MHVLVLHHQQLMLRSSMILMMPPHAFFDFKSTKARFHDDFGTQLQWKRLDLGLSVWNEKRCHDPSSHRKKGSYFAFWLENACIQAKRVKRQKACFNLMA